MVSLRTILIIAAAWRSAAQPTMAPTFDDWGLAEDTDYPTAAPIASTDLEEIQCRGRFLCRSSKDAA